jgi:hypothetical protein
LVADGHEPMLIQKLKDLGFQGVVHKPRPESLKPNNSFADARFDGLDAGQHGAMGRNQSAG